MEPQSLLEATRMFSTPEKAHAYLAKLRWPDGRIGCPSCGCIENYYLATQHRWKCKACKRQFSVKVGTIFEDSPISLDKWLIALWLIVNCKNGISSYELARGIGVTQKSAWFMNHRIRLALQAGSFDKISGEVQVDETLIGGRRGTCTMAKHPAVRVRSAKPSSWASSEANGKVRTFPVPNPQKRILEAKVREHVAEAQRSTPTLTAPTILGQWFDHQVIDHATTYVEGNVTTNGIENYWSLLKRTISGT